MATDNGAKYDYSITLGSCGRATWNSGDGGVSWMHQRHWFQPPESPIVRALTPHPTEPHTLFAGAGSGLFRSQDNGRAWEIISSTPHNLNIWSVAVDPTNPDTIFLGTSPANIFRSQDGGHKWQIMEVPNIVTWCETGFIRVTGIVIDPDDPRHIFAGLEVNGVRRSLDGGDSWDTVRGPWGPGDIHTMAIAKVNGTTRYYANAPKELYVSEDVGETWEPMGIGNYFTKENYGNYFRWFAVKPDDQRVLFAGTGSFNVGDAGSLFRSNDGGETWETLTTELNSTVMGIGVNPADPNRVVACTSCGEVWVSDDGGDSWRKVQQIFGELLCATWQPNSEEFPWVYNPSGKQAMSSGGTATLDTINRGYRVQY